MKKVLTLLTVCFVMISLGSTRAFAISDGEISDIAEKSGAEKLESDYLSEDEISGDKTINIFEKAIEIITDSFAEKGISVLKSMGLIMSILVLCCVMNSMKFGGSEALDNASSFISVLILAGVTYSVLYNLFILVIASMETLTLTMSSLMPIMASLHAFGGTVSTGAATASGLTVFLTAVSLICTKIILPLLQISFGLCLSGALPGSVNLSPVTNLVRSVSTTLMAFVFTLFGFVLYFQTTVASAGDGFVNRSVRFASGVFVPVIGGMLGDASRTVAASVSVIKGTVGAAGVVMIFSVVLPPLIITVLNKLMLLVCSTAAKAMGCEREGVLLCDLGGILGVLLALVLGAGVVSIIALAMFVKVSAS